MSPAPEQPARKRNVKIPSTPGRQCRKTTKATESMLLRMIEATRLTSRTGGRASQLLTTKASKAAGNSSATTPSEAAIKASDWPSKKQGHGSGVASGPGTDKTVADKNKTIKQIYCRALEILPDSGSSIDSLRCALYSKIEHVSRHDHKAKQRYLQFPVGKFFLQSKIKNGFVQLLPS